MILHPSLPHPAPVVPGATLTTPPVVPKHQPEHREHVQCEQCRCFGDWPGDFCTEQCQRTWCAANTAQREYAPASDSGRMWGCSGIPLPQAPRRSFMDGPERAA